MRWAVLAVALAACNRAGPEPVVDPPAPVRVRVPDGLQERPEIGPEAQAEIETYAPSRSADDMRGFKFVEGPMGNPAVMGCADGQREGFADVQRFPRIAGCLAQWGGMKGLRDKRTGIVCGDDRRRCSVPADACARGWHVCGANGRARDLASRVTSDQCSARVGPGRFNAAFSHAPDENIVPCTPVTPATVFPCVRAGVGSQPVCCGEGCVFPNCRDAAWPGRTQVPQGRAEGCGALTSALNGGILCCRDPALTK